MGGSGTCVSKAFHSIVYTFSQVKSSKAFLSSQAGLIHSEKKICAEPTVQRAVLKMFGIHAKKFLYNNLSAQKQQSGIQHYL